MADTVKGAGFVMVAVVVAGATVVAGPVVVGLAGVTTPVVLFVVVAEVDGLLVITLLLPVAFWALAVLIVRKDVIRIVVKQSERGFRVVINF